MMRAGDLDGSTGTAVETIRFYEREALPPAARRTDNNDDVYSTAHAERLAFIGHCSKLDMALDEIRTLLRLRDAATPDCGEVNALLDAHIGRASQRIRESSALQVALTALRARAADRKRSRSAASSTNSTPRRASSPAAANTHR